MKTLKFNSSQEANENNHYYMKHAVQHLNNITREYKGDYFFRYVDTSGSSSFGYSGKLLLCKKTKINVSDETGFCFITDGIEDIEEITTSKTVSLPNTKNAGGGIGAYAAMFWIGTALDMIDNSELFIKLRTEYENKKEQEKQNLIEKYENVKNKTLKLFLISGMSGKCPESVMTMKKSSGMSWKNFQNAAAQGLYN